MMNTPILNRDFQHPTDGWYQIEAKGLHPNDRANLVQVIDDEACASITNRFNQEAAKSGFAGMLIDHEHFKHDDDKETRAYGWLMALQNRADGLYGQIRWTGTGKKAVDDGDYRFFSTEYDLKDSTVVNSGEKPKRIRPMRLDGLTLTNVNNNKGQKPITNRLSAETDGTPKAKQMKTVCTLLGLSADASEEAVHAVVTKLIQNRDAYNNDLTKITNRATTAEARVKELEAIQVETDLATYANRFDPKQQEFIKSLLVTNREKTVEFLKAQPARKDATSPVRIHNRDTAQPMDANIGAEEQDEQVILNKQREAIDTIRAKNPKWSYEKARNMVRSRNPELFGIQPEETQTASA